MRTRRDFIKTSCLQCAALLGSGLLLQSCGTGLQVFKTQSQNNQLRVPLQEFTADKNMVVVRAKELEHDILVVKKDDHYNALYLQCTHEGVGLSATNNKIVCTAHGSTFDFDGNVLKEPALKPLKKFQTSISNNAIIITLT